MMLSVCLPVYFHFSMVFDEVCVQVSGPFLLSYLFTYSWVLKDLCVFGLEDFITYVICKHFLWVWDLSSQPLKIESKVNYLSPCMSFLEVNEDHSNKNRGHTLLQQGAQAPPFVFGRDSQEEERKSFMVEEGWGAPGGLQVWGPWSGETGGSSLETEHPMWCNCGWFGFLGWPRLGSGVRVPLSSGPCLSVCSVSHFI